MLAHPLSGGNYATRGKDGEEEWKLSEARRNNGKVRSTLRPIRRLFLHASIASVLAFFSRSSAAGSRHDLVILGATPAGIVAGVAAARGGRS